jgi:tol-pal system protein YbgF
VRRLPLLFLIPAALSACAGNDVIVQRQSSMEGRLEQVMQAQNSSKSEITGLAVQIKELREQLAKHAAAESDAQSRYEALQSKVKILALRLEQVEAPARQPATVELVNHEAGSAGREDSVQAEYMQAFGLFSADKYTAAADAFNSFIANYPEGEYAANARFWLGECYFNTGRYREAIDSFTKVLDMKPAAGRAADALFKIGLSWQKLGNPAKSSTALQSVVDTYPESKAAAQAQQHLNRK